MRAHTQAHTLHEEHGELEYGLDAVGLEQRAGRRHPSGPHHGHLGEALRTDVLPRAADDGEVRLRVRGAVHAEEADGVVEPAFLEHGGHSHGLADALLRAGDVEALRAAHRGGPQLRCLRQLVVHHGHGPEEELLQRGALREAASGEDRHAVPVPVPVAVAADGLGGVGGAAQAREEGNVVVVDGARRAGVDVHAAVERQHGAVGPREGQLPGDRGVVHDAGHDARRRVRAPEDVVHEEDHPVAVSAARCTRSRGPGPGPHRDGAGCDRCVSCHGASGRRHHTGASYHRWTGIGSDRCVSSRVRYGRCGSGRRSTSAVVVVVGSQLARRSRRRSAGRNEEEDEDEEKEKGRESDGRFLERHSSRQALSVSSSPRWW
jgi:hypothetical protein